MLAAMAAATPLWAVEVSNVKARQRWPWNGLVDITCTVSGINGTDHGLDFAVEEVMDSGIYNATHFWTVRDGKKSDARNVETNGNYRLLWDAGADLGPELYSNVVVRVTVKGHAKVQLWEGGPYWATTNVGAENPEDYGLYFWWGDTVGYRREGESWVASNRPGSGFSFWNGNVPTCDKGIATLQSEKWITADGVLAPDHDAAHVHWGGKWRMPTKQESDDLSSKCNWNETTRNGVKGWTVTGKGAYGSASIFLPCAGCGNGTSLNFAGTRGYYRLSVPNPDDSAGAWSLGFDSDGPYLYFSSWRHIGQSVRPVQGFTDALMAAAGVAHAGDSAKMVLDLRTGPRASGGDETLTYSSLWDGGADATVTIAQDGVAIAENLAGEGERAWSVPYNGTYELTHVTYTNGVAGKVETATFVVTGKAEPPEITNVVATPSEPWDGTVSISFNVVNSPAAACPDWNQPYLSIVATDNETGSNYVADVSALSGDTDTADGAHMVTWDMDGQGIKFYSTNVTFTVAYLSRQLNDYCVIDLSCGEQGTGAARCPVSYLAAPPEGGWTDAYRTTNLVLRLVRPGTFTMGSPDPEDADQGMGAHEVTISSPFYIGVFETTQWQWRQVTGSNPSQAPGDTHPVEGVSYNMARGASWPSSPNPSSDSFLGMLRSMTGIDFDLPLEEQWEYACRAGTTTKYNSGDDDEASMNNLGRYEDNCNDGKGGGETHAAVGSYAPNAWGIYDMHGNVCEWCLDWYDPNLTRVRRGGSWLYGASGCTSYFRMRSFPTSKSPDYGFRLCCSVGGENGAGEPFVVCSGASEPTTAGKKPAAELAAELKWKHLKATGTYFAQLKLTCTNWLDSGISDLKFMFADRVGADGKTSAALWSTPLRSANTNVEESDGTTYRFVALDESLIEEENTPVVYGVADLSAAAIPVAERTIEMYVRTGVAPEGQNAASAQVDDFVGYVCWTSSDEACAVPVVASGAQSSPKFGAVRPLAGASLPSPKTLNESLALGVPVVEGASPYCRVAEFSVDGERIKGRIEVGAGENVGALGANATVTVLGAASPAGPFEELGAVEVAEDGSFSLAVAEGAQFFKLRIDVKEVVR